MATSDHNPQSSSIARQRFHTTEWSVVVAAGRTSSPDSRDALATLCQTYWYPVYAYVRRKAHSPSDAQDLTQEFFTRLLEKNVAGQAERAKGKFRAFLLASLSHFLAKERHRAGAGKRGGGRALLSLDFEAGECRYSLEPAHDLTAERIYERRWALTLLDQTVAKLRDEFVERGKLDLFDNLKGCLGGTESTLPYRHIAETLGMTESAVKVAVYRLRRRCRELLLHEISQTVTGPEAAAEELRDLFEVVNRK